MPWLKESAGERRGPCSLHKGTRDSFALDAQTGLWTCHACGRAGDIIAFERELSGADFKMALGEVLRITGRVETPRKHPKGSAIVAEYGYQDESGRVLFQTVRYDPKDFKQRKPDGKGGWIWNIKDVRLVLYRLPGLLKRPTDTIFVCEGEKDVHALETLGFLATCNPMGAGKWRDSFAETLRGKRVVVITDNDPARDERGKAHFKGQKHAATVAESLLRHGCEVRIVEPSRGKDASDWLEAGGTAEEIDRVVHACPALTLETLGAWRERWLAPDAPATGSATNEWPKPLPLQSDLPSVPRFSEELLPASFRPLVRDVSERMQVPMDYPAIVMILSLAGAVNRRAMIQPKEKDSGWVEPANLWGAIIGPPGVMKTPVIQAAVQPLTQIQTEWRQEHESRMSDYTQSIEEWEITKSAWKEQLKAHKRNSKKPRPERPPDPPPPPRLRRLIVNDSTFEALHQTMSQNPSGVLLLRDEIVGWLAGLDKAGHETERAFCLEAWNGKNPYTVDRIGRGTIHVPACCMSLFGGIQPGRLRSYLTDALEDGPSNDGLIQRFQLLVWPDVNTWEYVDRAPNIEAQELAASVYRRLVDIGSEAPMIFRFAPGAQELFIEWLSDLEGRIRSDELHPALIAHLSKYRKLMPVLALLFELADQIGSVGFDGSFKAGDANFVNLEHARQAAALCDYLESHARRVYSCVVTPQLRAARELAEKLKKRKAGADGSFSCREIYLKGWSGLNSPEAVKQAADILVDARWIRVPPSEPRPQGGRPPDRYDINPAVWE